METKPFRHTIVTMLVCCFGGAASTHAEPLAAASVESAGGVVAADHAVASEIGAGVLAAGGNAADAAVGTLLALGVVNPSSSGLGGGGFCLVRPADGDVDVIDFRERAPAAAHLPNQRNSLPTMLARRAHRNRPNPEHRLMAW